MSSTATFLLPAMIPNTQGNDSSYFPFIQFVSGGQKGLALEPPINKSTSTPKNYQMDGLSRAIESYTLQHLTTSFSHGSELPPA